MEVLVAFSLLAILLTVIIQSQGEMTFFLEKTQTLSKVQKAVVNELQKIEREYKFNPVQDAEGIYPEDHPLAGKKWERRVIQEDFMGLAPVLKITHRIYWSPASGGDEQYFEASILGDVLK